MLCWSFCIIFLWTYICTCTFTVQYCFEWLQQETANTGKTKIGENAIKKKNSLFCSFVRKLFYSGTGYFYIFTRTCTPHLWKYISTTTHWISSIYDMNWISLIIWKCLISGLPKFSSINPYNQCFGLILAYITLQRLYKFIGVT